MAPNEFPINSEIPASRSSLRQGREVVAAQKYLFKKKNNNNNNSEIQIILILYSYLRTHYFALRSATPPQ